MNQTARHPDLETYDALVGEWSTSATHPAYPSVEVSGSGTFEWLAGGHFLIGRSLTDHPDFPDALTVLGADGEALAMHYYDSRGVERIYQSSRIEDGVWKMWRDAPGFSQRFTGMFSEDGNTITGHWELSRDGSSWDADLEITYTRSQWRQSRPRSGSLEAGQPGRAAQPGCGLDVAIGDLDQVPGRVLEVERAPADAPVAVVDDLDPGGFEALTPTSVPPAFADGFMRQPRLKAAFGTEYCSDGFGGDLRRVDR